MRMLILSTLLMAGCGQLSAVHENLRPTEEQSTVAVNASDLNFAAAAVAGNGNFCIPYNGINYCFRVQGFAIRDDINNYLYCFYHGMKWYCDSNLTPAQSEYLLRGVLMTSGGSCVRSTGGNECMGFPAR